MSVGRRISLLLARTAMVFMLISASFKFITDAEHLVPVTKMKYSQLLTRM